jgi:hypothetical protein
MVHGALSTWRESGTLIAEPTANSNSWRTASSELRCGFVIASRYRATKMGRELVAEVEKGFGY